MRALTLALLLLPLPALADGFQLPSGNIHCYVSADDGGGADCEIIDFDGGPLLDRPADCDMDWGHRFMVTGWGAASMLCAGDTVRDPSNPVLQYGQGLKAGGVTCTSSRSGLECVNRDGHGFRLARAGQSLF